MTKWILRVGLLMVFALGTIVLTAPLGFVLDRAQSRLPGLQWGQVQGTMWSGRISNVSYGRQLVGDVSLRLKPLHLFSARLAYDLELQGPVAAGSAVLYSGRERFGLHDADLTARIDQMIGLNRTVREAGGRLRVTMLSLELDRALACQGAGGVLSTDVLSNLGASYGESLPELTGGVSCEGDMFAMGLDGISQTGINVQIDARFGSADVSSLNARLEGASDELAQALSALGFSTSDGEFVYVRELGP